MNPQRGNTDFPVNKNQLLMSTIKSNHIFFNEKEEGYAKKMGKTIKG